MNAPQDGPENGFKQADNSQWKSGFIKFPALIWYDFQNQQIRPVKVSFQGTSNSNQMPTKFQFIGANGECKAKGQWHVLCENDYGKNSTRAFGDCLVGNSSQKYRCLGLKVLATEGKDRAGLCKIRMWQVVD